jgi:nicotinate-nucleotide pyrophosphorylase (carboxylating)
MSGDAQASLTRAVVEDIVRRALEEDIGTGDVTTAAIVGRGASARATFVAKGPCVLAGIDVAREVFRQVDSSVELVATRRDGERCEAGDEFATVRGSAAALLTAERTALNFLQYLSGIATLARAFVTAANGRLRILDTRKTAPGLRALAKYAVRCGGAVNHRAGLYDGILIKENHIRLAGGLATAVARVRAAAPGQPIEVEAQSPADVEAALDAKVDIIMLDNLDDAATVDAIRRIGGRARTELSGNMTLERVERLSASGADEVSIGAMTHSAPAADISLEVEIDVRSAAG